jgi:transposase
LPEVICIDEFKNLRSAEGKYAFLILDPLAHKIVDVLEDRKTETLEKYFYFIPWYERKKIKYIVSDMYCPYRTLIKQFFPYAIHVIDAYHYTEYVSNAFNDVRIRIQKQFAENTKEYRVIKNNWKLLSTFIKEIPSKDMYNAYQQKYTFPSDIINDCLTLSNELTSAYSMYQDFLLSINNMYLHNAEEFISQ